MTRHAAAVLIAALLAACAAVGPDYKRPEMNIPGAFPHSAATGAATVPTQWWKLYADPALDGLIAGALERNADIRVAIARIEEADANLREVGAALLPQVDLGAADSRSQVSTRTAVPLPPGAPALRDNLRITASTSFELDFWGKLRRSAEAARALALASRYGRDVVALSLAGLISQAYFSLRSLDAQIAVTRETLANRAETLAMVRKRADGGIASALDVNQALAVHADAASQLKELVRQRALIEHQIGSLTGRPDLAVTAGDLRVLPVPPAPPAGLPSALLERRPDIQQAEQQLVAANAQIGIAKAAMLPAISLTGTYGSESQALSTLLGAGTRIWSLGFGLALPIFDSGRYAARTDAAIARQRQSLAAYQKSIETAFREVADALTSLRQTGETEHDLQTRLDAARNVLRLARMRYEAGYSSFLEVLDAQRTANDSELALLRMRQVRLAASVDLMKALGGGWSAEAARTAANR